MKSNLVNLWACRESQAESRLVVSKFRKGVISIGKCPTYSPLTTQTISNLKIGWQSTSIVYLSWTSTYIEKFWDTFELDDRGRLSTDFQFWIDLRQFWWTIRHLSIEIPPFRNFNTMTIDVSELFSTRIKRCQNSNTSIRTTYAIWALCSRSFRFSNSSVRRSTACGAMKSSLKTARIWKGGQTIEIAAHLLLSSLKPSQIWKSADSRPRSSNSNVSR